MVRKHNKYSQEYFDEVKKLVLKKNTTEKDDKGNVIDKPEIELLGDKRNEVEIEITELEKEIQTGKQSTKKVKDACKGYNYLKGRVDDMKVGGNPANYHTNHFHNAGGNNFNWDAKMKNHFQKDDASKGKDNKYLLTINGANKDITEEQVINVIARICHGLSEITDVADFKTKFANWDAGNATNFNTLLDNLIKDGKQVKKGAKAYDLTHTYTQHITNDHTDAKHDTVYPDSRAITATANDFYAWMNLVDGKKTVSGVEKTLPEMLAKDNTHSETIPIYLLGEAWKKNELKDWFGIELKNTQDFYKSSDNYENFALSGGIGGWIELGKTISQSGNANKDKLVYNFTANAPTTTVVPNGELFASMRTQAKAGRWDEVHKTFSDGTDIWGLENTNNLDGANSELDELEAMKSLIVQEVALSNLELNKKKTEKTTKETKKSKLDTKIDELITDELTTRRTALATYKIVDGFELTKKADGTVDKDNRKTYLELTTIKSALSDIRFLEKADEEASSSEDSENTAFDAVKTLIDDYKNSKVHDFSLVEGSTNADKCKEIKKGGDDKLQTYHDDYKAWDNKIKLNDSKKAEQTAIETALGKKEDPMETLETYKEKLKELDPILTDAIITQAIVDDWKTQNNFKTAETMTAEIKKVLKDKALDDTFKAVMTKADSEITDLGKLLQKKKAKEIITLIRRWEYDKNTDTDKRKKLVWTLELKNPKDNKKYLDDKELTDEEINKVLYEIATGKKTLRSEKKADETTDNNDNNEQNDKSKEWWQKGFYWPFWTAGLVIIGGGLVWYFWDKIMGNEPKDDELTSAGDEKEGDE